MRENLFAAGRELAFLISTAMKSQYSNCEAAAAAVAASFGIRSFIFLYFSLLFVSLYALVTGENKA